jgi:hypothetical protein
MAKSATPLPASACLTHDQDAQVRHGDARDQPGRGRHRLPRATTAGATAAVLACGPVRGPAVAVVRTLALVAVLAPVSVLGYAAYSGGSILWRSVQGTVVSAERVAKKGCGVRVEGARSSLTVELAFDACDRVRVGDTFTKAAWSLDVQNVAPSGEVWKGAVPHVVFSLVALLFMGVVGLVAVLSIFIHLPIQLPRRTRGSKARPVL